MTRLVLAVLSALLLNAADDDSAGYEPAYTTEADEAPAAAEPVQEQVQAVVDDLCEMQALGAYLSDRAAYKAGEAPAGFVMQSLADYKAKKIKAPLLGK